MKNPGRNAIIVAHVESGKSYGQVAELVGVSRNAVAGVIHRHRVKEKVIAESEQ